MIRLLPAVLLLITAGCTAPAEADPVTATFEICRSGPRVNCVVDGDTAWIDGQKVRLEGVDTPEIFSPECPAEKALGMKARDRLLELLNQGPFELEGEGEDRYDRQLRTVVRDGESLGDQLVDEGLARQWTGRREPWCE